MLFAFKFTSPLRDVSHLCDISIIDLSKIICASFKAFHNILVMKPISITPALSLAWKASEKNPPGQKDHSRQKQTTCWKYFFISIIMQGPEYTGSASLVDNNRYQSISINWLILKIDDQLMTEFLVICMIIWSLVFPTNFIWIIDNRWQSILGRFQSISIE